MTNIEIETVLVKALNRKKGLEISNYVQNNGVVVNLTIFELGDRESYRRKIRQSLKILNRGIVNPGFALEVWQQALEEQRASWEASFAKHHDTPDQDLQFVRSAVSSRPARSIWKSEHGPVLLYSFGHTTELFRPEGYREPRRNPLTLAKAALALHTPMRFYIPRINLYPAKLAGMEIL